MNRLNSFIAKQPVFIDRIIGSPWRTRKVQLFYDKGESAIFEHLIIKLAMRYGTAGVPATVMAALEHANEAVK